MKGDNFYRKESSNQEKENKGKDKEEKEADRLTKLPDEIILHILSFVEAKTTVHTSVLNKRYRYLWDSRPVLNFVDSFDLPEIFNSFVTHFLAYRDTSINFFNVNLEFLYSYEDEYLRDYMVYLIVNSTIEHVIGTPSVTTTIEGLSIDSYSLMSDLPKLSVCTSLTTLKLSNISIDTANFDIPTLKHLYLCYCQFDCELESAFDPFEGFIKIESLYLHGCTYSAETNPFKLSPSHLVDLNMSGLISNGYFLSDSVFQLQSPRLKHFKYTGYDNFYPIRTEINLLFVEKRYIDLRFLDNDTNSLYTLIEPFEIMQSATSISLSLEICHVLSMFPHELEDKCSPFTRMQNYEIICDDSCSVPRDVKKYLFGAY